MPKVISMPYADIVERVYQHPKCPDRLQVQLRPDADILDSVARKHTAIVGINGAHPHDVELAIWHEAGHIILGHAKLPHSEALLSESKLETDAWLFTFTNCRWRKFHADLSDYAKSDFRTALFRYKRGERL